MLESDFDHISKPCGKSQVIINQRKTSKPFYYIVTNVSVLLLDWIEVCKCILNHQRLKVGNVCLIDDHKASAAIRGWCCFNVFVLITSWLISTTWVCIMYYKNVRVEAPVEFVQQLNRITSRQTHTMSRSLFALFLFFHVSLLCSDSSIYRHRFSQLGVKFTFLHTSHSRLTDEVSDSVLFSSLKLHLFQVGETALV